MRLPLILVALSSAATLAFAGPLAAQSSGAVVADSSPFRPLQLATPNAQRTANGRPGRLGSRVTSRSGSLRDTPPRRSETEYEHRFGVAHDIHACAIGLHLREAAQQGAPTSEGNTEKAQALR
jgi:hypothetical protein